MTLLSSILQSALRRPLKIAIRDDCGATRYIELLAGALHLAEGIDRRTCRSHVGLLLPTSAAFPAALVGCWLTRRTAVPLNYLLSSAELQHLIHDAELDLILTIQPMLDMLGGPAAFPAHVQLWLLDQHPPVGLPPLRRLLGAFRRTCLPSDDEVAVLLYTSGTSAQPKGVMLTYANLYSNVQACLQHARITDRIRFFGCLPQFHSFGLTVLTLLPLSAGCSVTHTARFIPQRILELLRRDRPQLMAAVPSMYAALLALKNAQPQDFASLQLAISGGEALPTSLARAFHQRFGVQLLQGYGLTETSPVLTWCTPWANREGSVGLPLPDVDIRIIDANDQILPPGQEGEIVAAGPNIMKGYYKQPELTRQAMVSLQVPTPHGLETRRYFRTGDLGRLDPDGFLYITGRKKDILKVAGEMVVPAEIEEVLLRHPDVAAAAVLGRPDPLRGQVPIAFVEPRRTPLDPQALRAWCQQYLPRFKVPREIYILPSLPRSPTGKLLKRLLIEMLQQTSSPLEPSPTTHPVPSTGPSVESPF